MTEELMFEEVTTEHVNGWYMDFVTGVGVGMGFVAMGVAIVT